MSATVLGGRLGIRKSVKRVLQDDATDAVRRAVFERICEREVFADNEVDALREALQVSRMGVQRVASDIAISQLLGLCTPPAPPTLCLRDGTPLLERLQMLNGADRVEILCINSCVSSLYIVLGELFASFQGELRMRHYLNCVYAARYINCVSPILYDRRYEPYGLRAAECDRTLLGNMLCIRITSGERVQEYNLVVRSLDVAYELPYAPRLDLFSFLETLISDLPEPPTPLKMSKAENMTYLSIIADACQRELNRPLYYLGVDIPFQAIPAKLAMRAISEKGIIPPDQQRSLFATAEPIHESRRRNFFHKKKPTYFVTALGLMRNYLETGMGRDHFFAMRAFTPEERITVFALLLDHAEESHGLHLYLLREDQPLPNALIVAYGLESISLMRSDDHYDLPGFDYLLLSYPAFYRAYIDFYVERLLPEHCLSEADSMRQLRALEAEYREKFGL